jgi:hypothetical protein
MHGAIPFSGRRGVLLLVLLSLATTSACSSSVTRYARIDRALQAGDPAAGVAILEKSKRDYGSRSAVLYLMDKGMLQHLAGHYTASNRSLTQAEAFSEDLYTARISSEIEAFLTTDNALPYEGEEFEKVMLNLLMAMNYVHLGQWDDALVEARKVDHKLNVLGDRNNGRMSYTTDAFARYLSGVLYEATGDLSNAFVAYRLAFEAFQQYRARYGLGAPDLLRQDLLRVSEALGLNQEHQEYRLAFPGTAWQSESTKRGSGELVFITYAGHAPVKRDVFVDVPFGLDSLNVVLATKGSPRYYLGDYRTAESLLYGLTGRVVRLAVPQFMPRRSAIAYAEAVAINGESRHTARSVVMEDITAIAMKDLEDRLLRTTAKAAARAVWKYALTEGVRIGVREAVGNKEAGVIAGAIAGAMARVIAIASEEADKRSWLTLPDQIHVGRVTVPPGTYDLEFRYVGRSGSVIERHTMQGVTVTEGQTRFVTTRVLQ